MKQYFLPNRIWTLYHALVSGAMGTVSAGVTRDVQAQRVISNKPGEDTSSSPVAVTSRSILESEPRMFVIVGFACKLFPQSISGLLDEKFVMIRSALGETHISCTYLKHRASPVSHFKSNGLFCLMAPETMDDLHHHQSKVGMDKVFRKQK